VSRNRQRDQEILAQLPAARARTAEAERIEPRAERAGFDHERGMIVVELKSGCIFGFPPELGAGLDGATPAQLAEVEVEPGGEGLHWEELDADVSVPGIMARLLNLREWAPRYLGQLTSEAKAKAARENGRKGGRPRKNPQPGSYAPPRGRTRAVAEPPPERRPEEPTE